MPYRITTDSNCDLPASFYKERDIAYIPMGFVMKSQEYRETADCPVTSREFYDYLREGGIASTVQINTYEFIEFAEPFLKAGEDILHIAFSGGLSGTADAMEKGAAELRQKYPDRKITVIDSLCASMGEGLFLFYADENRRAGMNLEENAQWLTGHRLNICQFFTVDDLAFLHRGGRVSKTSAILGSMIGIKPILHVDDEGHLTLISKSRGRAASLKALADKMKEAAGSHAASQTVFISHGDCPEDAEKLEEILRKELDVKNFLINPIGAVIGSHAGPGTVALFFMGNKR